MTVFRSVLAVCTAIGVLAFPGIAAADYWEDLWKELSQGQVIVDDSPQHVNVYNAEINFTIENLDGRPGNFGGADLIHLTITGKDMEPIVFDGNPQALVAWAKDNADHLVRAIFGNAPDRIASGATSSALNAQDLLSADPAPAAEGSNEKNPFAPISTRDIVLKGQYDTVSVGFENNTSKGTGSSGLLNYGQRFGPDLSNTLGIGIPYRQMNMKDDLSTKYQCASFLPYFKHRWYGGRTVVEGMLNLVGNVSYLQSDLMPDGAGYFEYGAGTGVKAGFQAASAFDVTGGLSYEVLKRNAPAGLVPEELRWLADTINDLPLQQNVIPAVGFVVRAIPRRLTLRGEFLRIMQLQSGVEEGTRNQTVAMGLVSLRVGKASEIALGYKRSFEVEGLTDASYSVDLRFRF